MRAEFRRGVAGSARFGRLVARARAAHGEVTFLDGSHYKPSVPIELDAALSQAGSAVGFLAFLRSFTEDFEGAYAAEALRSLVAPEQDSEVFREWLEIAGERERSCRKL